MGIQLANPTVTVSNVVVAVIPNSVTFTEGLGEQNIRAASGGGSNVEQIFSNNIETNFSTVKFDIPATPDNIALAREWKVKQNANLVQISGRTVGDGKIMTRTFSQAALLSDYEVALGSDTNISLEFKANPAV